jgi:nucleoside phosphorylase
VAKEPHVHRKEIARYLLGRGLDQEVAAPPSSPSAEQERKRLAKVGFAPADAPVPRPISPAPSPGAKLPAADVIVITWTADEADALAHVFTEGHSWKPVAHKKTASKTGAARKTPRASSGWYGYSRGFASYRGEIRDHAPALKAKRLASYMPVEVAGRKVLCMKSELHLNQDGIVQRDSKKGSLGKATLPVRRFFRQIIEESGAKHVFTIGTAGSVFDQFALGDVVITRAARFRCQEEFANEPFNNKTYRSKWEIPTKRLKDARALMRPFFAELKEPPVGPPSLEFGAGKLAAPRAPRPQIRLDGKDMPAFHPILTTDYFEYGTTLNRLDRFGAAVEMGDAALGLACRDLGADAPHWAVVRNMSDPVINGALPAKQFHLNEQTTWAVGFYTAYGKYTSLLGAIATWGVIAGLP